MILRPLIKACCLSSALLLIGLLPRTLMAQADSSGAESNVRLQASSEQRKKFQLKADAIKIKDSLEELSLLQQIADLSSRDQKTKQALLARFDSIQKLQEVQQVRLRAEVDSLRSSTPGIPVTLGEDTLFRVYSKVGAFSPSDRAISISKKISLLAESPGFKAEHLVIQENELSSEILYKESAVLSISEQDAFWVDMPRQELAAQYRETILNAVDNYKHDRGIMATLMRFGLLILVVALFFLGIRYLNKGFTRFNEWVFLKGKKYLNGIKIKNYELLSEEREESMVRTVLRVLKWIIILFLVYLALPTIFSIFPATKGIANVLFNYIWSPVRKFALAFISYIPNLITIAVIIAITRYGLRLLRFLATEVEQEKLVLPGFYPDWSKPTYSLFKIVIYAFSFIVIFPYLPGSESPVFQGVSVFLGLIISLGSTSAIGNIIAGLVITYMRAFKVGDRVKISDTVGDVIEKTMLVTRIRTIKNEDVSIPNLAILSGSTINYSSSAKNLGLILHSTITIGYDVPWKTVHQLLIDAALKIEAVKKTPQPFVLQTSLDDFYVSYQINCYTISPESAAKIYSELHANIQDGFNKSGIEILSPHYRAARDGSAMAVPPEYLPKDYKSPPFNIKRE